MLDNWINYLAALDNSARRRLMIAIDVCMLFAATYIAVSVILGPLNVFNASAIFAIIYAVVLSIVILTLTKSYRAIIRHLDAQTIGRIFFSLLLASLIWGISIPYMDFAAPHELSLFLLQSILTLTFLIGFRISIFLYIGKSTNLTDNFTNVAVFGLEQSSRQFAAYLKQSKNYKPVFLFADTPTLDGGIIGGLRVYSYEHLDWAIKRFEPSIFVFPEEVKTSGKHAELIRQIVHLGIEVKFFDGLDESMSKKLVMEIAKPVEIEDLLRRKENPVNEKLLKEPIAGKRILVTGAAGTIGSEVALRVASLSPAHLALIDIDESGLVHVREEISKNQIPAAMYLGSINDRQLLDQIIQKGKFDVIIHAAAYKHVSMGEACPKAVMNNNIIGTFNLIEAAIKGKVPHFLQISTNKSVEPTSVMGATKLWCEKIVSAFAKPEKEQHFSSVRFGNVIESRVSGIPQFKKQIAAGGPVTVTDERMERFFMTINEAVDLVIQSIALTKGGEVFVLDMGKSHNIMFIVRSLIQLAGKTIKGPDNPKGEIEVVFTGAYEGEKLEEKLFADHETILPTDHPSIMVSKQSENSEKELKELRDNLLNKIQNGTPTELKKTLKEQISLLDR